MCLKLAHLQKLGVNETNVDSHACLSSLYLDCNEQRIP